MFGLRWYNAKKTPVWHVWLEMTPSPHSHTLSKRPLSGMFGLRWFIPHTATLTKKDPCLECLAWDGTFPTQTPSPSLPSPNTLTLPTLIFFTYYTLYSLLVSLPPSPFSPLLPPYIVNSSSYHILHPPPSTRSESPLYSEEIWLIVK